MANTAICYNVVVFDVRDPELTHVYVRVDPAPGDPMDCDPNIFGWHFKTYPASLPTAYIHEHLLFRTQEHDPVMWPKQYPKDVL